jgi:hypothetical protein
MGATAKKDRKQDRHKCKRQSGKYKKGKRNGQWEKTLMKLAPRVCSECTKLKKTNMELAKQLALLKGVLAREQARRLTLELQARGYGAKE